MSITKEELLTLSKEEILKKTEISKTEIFEAYENFLNRSDRKVNGVSPEFAEKNPDYAKDNATNTGCWNCESCCSCKSCNSCKYCESCESCYSCYFCYFCESCYFNIKLTEAEYEKVKLKMN